MAQKSNFRSHGITFGGHVETHHRGGAARDWQQPCAQTQERGFSGTIGAFHENYLAAFNAQRCFGQCRKGTEKNNGVS